MAAEPMQVPVPICEVCWLIEHTSWEPESMDENGKILMRLTGVDVPEKINNESVDVCCECGAITIAGIYELRNPEDVPYLAEEDVSLGYYEDPTQFTFSLMPESDYDDGDGYE